MQLIIDIIEQPSSDGDPRNSAWIAVVTEAGNQPTEDAGIGRALTKGIAAKAALDNYLKRQKTLEAAKEAIEVAGRSVPQPITVQLDKDEVVSVPIGGTWQRKDVAVTPAMIKAFIESAILSGEEVRISGRKVNGDSFAGRPITPYEIKTLGIYDPQDVVMCSTFEGNRSFRLDLIDRVERA